MQPDFLLLDGMKGGSGEAIDWNSLDVPVHEATQGWILAGGLSPENVAKAATISKPTGVDVSSGVALADGVSLFLWPSHSLNSLCHAWRGSNMFVADIPASDFRMQRHRLLHVVSLIQSLSCE